MATSTNLENIQANRPTLVNKQNYEKATAEAKKAVDDVLKYLSEGLKTFEKNETKTRKEYNQLKIDSMKDELKKRGIGAAEIIKLEKLSFNERYKEFNKYYEKTKKALKLNLSTLEEIEKKQMKQRIAQNKEFYGKVDEGFKKFNKGITGVANALDTAIGGKLFGLIAKVTTLAAGALKNVFKIGMGGIKFVQQWREEGIGKAFQQTKIGQGVSAVGRGIGKAKDFVTGKSSDDRRAERDKEMKEQAAQDRVAKAAKGTTEAVIAEGKAEKKQREKWWAWEILKFGLIQTFLAGKWLLKGIGELAGLITKPLISLFSKFLGGSAKKSVAKKLLQHGRIGANKFFRTSAGKFLGGTKGGLTTKIIKSGLGIAGAIGGIKGLIKGITEFGEVSKKYGKGLEGASMGIANTAKNLGTGIISGLSFGLLKREKLNKIADGMTNYLSKRIATITETELKIAEGRSAKKRGISREHYDQMALLESIQSKTGARRKQFGNLKKDQEKWNLLSKEEQDYINLKLSGETGDDTFNVDRQLAQKRIDTSSFSANQQQKLKDSKTFLEGLLNKPSRNLESSRTLTIPPTTQVSGRKKGKSILLGQGVDFEGLKSDVKGKFTRMSDEYFEKTGHMVGVNSANRSLADQERLYRQNPDKAALPGYSPHQFGNAIDANSWNLNEMDKLGLLDKYGFERKARTRSGEWETWHTTPKGMTHEQAAPSPSSGSQKARTYYEAGDDVFGTDATYMEVGKKIGEIMSMSFSKDAPGKFLKEMQRTQTLTGEGKDSKEIIKLLTSINSGLDKAKGTSGKSTEESRSPAPSPAAASSSGTSAGFKTRSEVFPSDTMMTNMYALMTQFSGGY